MQTGTLDAWVMRQASPWHRLAAAVILKALKDAQGGDPEALRWVASSGVVWFDCLGLDGQLIADQVGRLSEVKRSPALVTRQSKHGRV